MSAAAVWFNRFTVGRRSSPCHSFRVIQITDVFPQRGAPDSVCGREEEYPERRDLTSLTCGDRGKSVDRNMTCGFVRFRSQGCDP